MKAVNAQEDTAGKAFALVDFGEALKALKDGKMIRRSIWHDHWLFLQVPNNVGYRIIPNMSSLPQSVKDELALRHEALPKERRGGFDIRYRNQIALLLEAGEIHSYAPCAWDVLATDWVIKD